MCIRHLVISAFLILLSTPAFAADYMIVQNTNTKVCSVVTQLPNDGSHVQIGYSTFSDRQSAAVAMNADSECVTAKAKTSTTDTKKK